MVKEPNLFIIGAPRSGTTALYAAFKQHPQVYTSVLKEPHYYASDLPVQPHTITSAIDYQELFQAAGEQRYRAEASVWYFFSTKAAAAMAQAHPGARIILLLRDPVEMLVSLYHLYRRSGNEGEADPNRALLRDSEACFEHSYFPFALHYQGLLHWQSNLLRWQQAFPAWQIRVLHYEDFYAAPGQQFQQLCRWLALTREPDISFDRDEARRRVQWQAMKQLRSLPAHIRQKMNPKAVQLHAGDKSSSVSPATRAALREYFVAHNPDLNQLLGSDVMARWGREAASEASTVSG